MNNSKQITAYIKSFFGHMGVYFTAIVMVLNTAFKMIFPSNDVGINTSMSFYIFLFCVIAALCDFIMNIKFIPSFVARLAIHFVLLTIDFAVVLVWLTDRTRSTKTVIFVVAVFAICLFIVDAVRVIVYNVKKRESNAAQEYKTMFSE